MHGKLAWNWKLGRFHEFRRLDCPQNLCVETYLNSARGILPCNQPKKLSEVSTSESLGIDPHAPPVSSPSRLPLSSPSPRTPAHCRCVPPPPPAATRPWRRQPRALSRPGELDLLVLTAWAGASSEDVQGWRRRASRSRASSEGGAALPLLTPTSSPSPIPHLLRANRRRRRRRRPPPHRPAPKP